MDTSLNLFLFVSILLLLGNIVFPSCKIHLDKSKTQRLQQIWIFFAIVLCISAVLAYFNTYLRGYWTTKVLIWIFVFISGFLYAIGNRMSVNMLIRKTSLLISLLPFFCTFIYLVSAMSGGMLLHFVLARTCGSSSFVFYDDASLRIERDNRGFRNRRSPRYFEKLGIFEIDKGSIPCTHRPDSVRVVKQGNSITFLCYDKEYKKSGMNNPHISVFKQ